MDRDNASGRTDPHIKGTGGRVESTVKAQRNLPRVTSMLEASLRVKSAAEVDTSLMEASYKKALSRRAS